MKKLKQMLILLVVVFAFTTVFSCSNDSPDDLIEATEDPIDPDVLVSYSNNVENIIQNACVACHANPPVNGAPFSLTNFTQVNQRANDILNRMSLQSGAAGAMPPSGRLPQTTIDIIDQWIDDGKLEN